MKKVPIQLRLAGIASALGAGLGSLGAAFIGPTFSNLTIGTLLGCAVGFFMGYRLGGMIKTSDSITRAEGVTSWADKVLMIMAWVFVAIGVSALFISGWNLPMFLSTLFFLICSLYITHRRFRTGK
jgi:hypothetical protein